MMNTLKNKLQALIKLTALLLVTFSLFLTTTHPAQATSNLLRTPEAAQYHSPDPVTSAKDKSYHETLKQGSDYAAENSRNLSKDQDNKLGSFADNIREKLNLDEPIDPNTKEFFQDVKKNVESILPGK